ncbi:MAG: hypothetical protein ACRENE_01640 [Polyangiaceae bacterium]
MTDLCSPEARMHRFPSIRPVTLGSLLLSIAACSSGSTGNDGTAAEAGTHAAQGDAGSDGGSLASGGPTDGGPGGDAFASATNGDAGSTGPALASGPPDFGPNVLIFDPSMSSSSIQSRIDAIFQQQQSAQFGTGRYAYFFKPGSYSLDVQLGFYMQALGLGASPDDVTITGAVRAKATWNGGNATTNFWRSAENLAVVPTQDGNVYVWAVSQGTDLRRLHVKGSINLWDGGWSSGGFIADSIVDTKITSGSQQQFLTRNSTLTSWNGGAWNMVFVGDDQSPTGTWPGAPDTVLATTPVIREKPYLTIDASGAYSVVVPALRSNSHGPTWGSGATAASSTILPIDRFYIAHPADTAASINAALAKGMHLVLTPGIYHLDAALQVSTAGTVVLGLGEPTLVATSGNALLDVADVDGVSLGGFLLEAGATSSPVLLSVGPSGSSASHTANPTALFDVHCRVGGADAGTAASCVAIDSSDVLVDNAWMWRADHGAGASWTGNPSLNGLVVNGSRVTAYGLFVEHFQQFQTLWNGEGGATYFYQSEMPYDPPNQSAWSHGGINGYASYKVADSVTTHTAWGLGVYCVFQNDVVSANAIETPTASGVAMHHMITEWLGSAAGSAIENIINGSGGAVSSGGAHSQKTSY